MTFSISVPCPKIFTFVKPKLQKTQYPNISSAPPQCCSMPTSKSCFSVGSSIKVPAFSGFQVAAEKLSNSVPEVDKKHKAALPKEDDKSAKKAIPDVSAISAFMTQVSDLVKLVDSRDITELQLKQSDCELVIRKKEALQPQEPVPPVFMPQYMPHAMFQTPPPTAAPAAAPTPSSLAPPALALPSAPPAKTRNSSHPPFKCPMAGTFYRSPAPGEPPFVKVGDKVQKGQVICIIEAMKLMNEIEADQSGTITEILAEDGKPVSVDMPLFVVVA